MNNRHYRVVASCYAPDQSHTMDERRAAVREQLTDILDSHRPDLVVFPEMGISYGFEHTDNWAAEPVTGPSMELVSSIAAERDVNICLPIVELHSGELYNTAVYVDRKGRIAGTYRKQVLTELEVRGGIRPGHADQSPVILDGMRVGTSICFDENFPDQMWHWIDAGVDLLVFPAYTYAGELIRNWAINCGVPLICSFPWESVIYDRDGSELVRAGTDTSTVRFGFHPAWIAATISFRSRIYHLDNNQPRLPDLIRRYGYCTDIRLMVRQGRMMITCHSDDIGIEEVERELGLTALQQYLRVSRSNQNPAQPG